MASAHSMRKKVRETSAARERRITEALGASVVIPLGRRSLGPLGLLAISPMLTGRLVSSGGRPTDPSWTVRRLVPFSSETWNRLTAEASRLSTSTRRMTPAQLAAILIERHLSTEQK